MFFFHFFLAYFQSELNPGVIKLLSVVNTKPSFVIYFNKNYIHKLSETSFELARKRA